MIKIRAKYRETPFLVGFWLGFDQKTEKNTLFGTALVRVRAKIEENTLFGRALVRVWAALVRVSTELKENTHCICFCLNKGKNRENIFLVGLW